MGKKKEKERKEGRKRRKRMAYGMKIIVAQQKHMPCALVSCLSSNSTEKSLINNRKEGEGGGRRRSGGGWEGVGAGKTSLHSTIPASMPLKPPLCM